MSCQEWDELKFIKHCHDELTPAEEAQFQTHLQNCAECCQNATIGWELFLNVPTLEEQAAINRDTEEFLNSKAWQEHKQQLVRKHANAIAQQNSVDIEKEAERFLTSKAWQQCKERLVKEHATAIYEQSTPQRQTNVTTTTNVTIFPKEKARPSKTPSSRYSAIMKIVAMVVMVFSPVLFTYLLLIKPYYEKQANNIVSATTIIETADIKTLAETFEDANTKLNASPQDTDALFVRAASSEKLLLLEDAKNDYQEYLSIENTSPRSIEVAQRLRAVNEKLSKLPSQKLTSYEQLNQHIDDYLGALQTGNSVGATNALSSAEEIANKMADQTGEKLGIDFVSYYRRVPTSAIPLLIKARDLASRAEATRDNFTDNLEKAYQAQAIFKQYEASCEVARTEITIAHCLNKIGRWSEADQIIRVSLERAKTANHLFSMASLKLEQGANLSQTSNFTHASKVLAEAIQIATPLEVSTVALRPSLVLTNIYYVTNDNTRAFEQAYKTLQLTAGSNALIEVQSLQILGGSAFNLNYPKLAEKYLQQSIAKAKVQNNLYLLSFSHMLYGLIQAEQKHPGAAESSFREAMYTAQQITDLQLRRPIEAAVVGYNARAQMLAGNSDKAIEMYTRALELTQQANIQQKLGLSQLHQGLGECFIAKGDYNRAETEMTLAVSLNREARANAEEQNTLLTFAVTDKSCDERMQLLRSRQN
ncbi:MAG: hypothetical protein AB1489_17785 [Acidobacteriota bacterium]